MGRAHLKPQPTDAAGPAGPKARLQGQSNLTWQKPAAPGYAMPLLISSVIFLASPNSIMVLSRQNSGLSTPA
jgi:hypothetical protein